jgi:hypothetical protein
MYLKPLQFSKGFAFKCFVEKCPWNSVYDTEYGLLIVSTPKKGTTDLSDSLH